MEEEGKFIEDALRLARDISGNQTFHTVKPLLNFWAAFTPSKEVCFLSLYSWDRYLLTYPLEWYRHRRDTQGVRCSADKSRIARRSWYTYSTAFGLYRDGTELRSVWYNKPEVARRACYSLGDKCDYPILMGTCK